MKSSLKKLATFSILCLFFLTSCKKDTINNETSPIAGEEQTLKAEADRTIQSQENSVAAFEKEFAEMMKNVPSENNLSGGQKNIVQIASSLPIFKSLVAAVVKTDLAGTLSSASLNATVFAPTDGAFAKLPAPFNNAANISAISDPAQIAALKNILLYHVLGTEVKRGQIQSGRSSVQTLKPAGTGNDNTIYLSNSLGLLFVNGNSLVLLANVDASNGVIHVIDNVLLPPSQNIAQIAIGNPAFSTLVAALVKTNLAGVFAGNGDFTVFAPTNPAFAKLPAPFNNAQNIAAISSPAQIAALSNILTYHVTGSRYFAWDLGIFNQITTLAAAPNNKLTGLLGINSAYVKGKQNPSFSRANPSNILATNGVVHVIDQVLLP